jgi:hypothetical protein
MESKLLDEDKENLGLFSAVNSRPQAQNRQNMIENPLLSKRTSSNSHSNDLSKLDTKLNNNNQFKNFSGKTSKQKYEKYEKKLSNQIFDLDDTLKSSHGNPFFIGNLSTSMNPRQNPEEIHDNSELDSIQKKIKLEDK